MATATEQSVIQGRFGFYPCDRETYKKLKELNFLAYLSLKVDKAHARWANKEPQNRVSKRWVRNPQGQKIQAVQGEPIPEPKRGYAGFNERVQISTYS